MLSIASNIATLALALAVATVPAVAAPIYKPDAINRRSFQAIGEGIVDGVAGAFGEKGVQAITDYFSKRSFTAIGEGIAEGVADAVGGKGVEAVENFFHGRSFAAIGEGIVDGVADAVGEEGVEEIERVLRRTMSSRAIDELA